MHKINLEKNVELCCFFLSVFIDEQEYYSNSYLYIRYETMHMKSLKSIVKCPVLLTEM